MIIINESYSQSRFWLGISFKFQEKTTIAYAS